ncbi:uncharacterized protein FAM241A isoform X1 [Archocentrus centrarchus]|uniref:uncharacterized protein FAM241A isoform X1 n=1 Tax=Archocentrus centrarchus TaxID=63155 RepID=UPI0011EA3C86|nr:uncharacterized protein FAM241A isoform X1 [Archocentrus centrarchus]
MSAVTPPVSDQPVYHRRDLEELPTESRRRPAPQPVQGGGHHQRHRIYMSGKADTTRCAPLVCSCPAQEVPADFRRSCHTCEADCSLSAAGQLAPEPVLHISVSNRLLSVRPAHNLKLIPSHDGPMWMTPLPESLSWMTVSEWGLCLVCSTSVCGEWASPRCTLGTK